MTSLKAESPCTNAEVLTFPTTFAQRRLWFLYQIEGPSAAYNIHQSLHLIGSLHRPALKQAVTEIVKRHEVLRTTFKLIDGEPSQVVTPVASVALAEIDLQSLPEQERLAASYQLAADEHVRPFNLEGPLLRVALVKLAEESHFLLLTVHHIIFDGWSVELFLEELATFYRAYCQGEPSSLPDLAIQYGDFADWQQQWFQGETLDTQLTYWKEQLAGIPPQLDLPTDYARSTGLSVAAEQSLRLSKSLSNCLKELSQQANATLFMTLLAAFSIVLHRYSAQDDIVIGSPVAGRNRPEIEPLIGFFVNTIVLRVSCKDNLSFLELLTQVRDVALEGYAHQDTPFEKLVEVLQPERILGRSPLFQVWFNMLNVTEKRLEMPGLAVKRFTIPEPAAKFDLTLYVRETDGSINFKLVYNAGLYRSERMVDLLAQLQYLLQQIVEQPTQSLDQFSLVTPEMARRLPNPQAPLPAKQQESIPLRFARQAKATPKNLAVVDSRNRLTYDTLDILTNRLANCLLERGIQPEDTVAIYGHRSAALVVALLGILKVGAAFIILDPAYPAARLVACLETIKPQGWISLEAAGEVSPVLEAYLNKNSLCRLSLPPTFTQSGPLFSDESQAPDVTLSDDTLAYIAFTSGTTGAPKGILGTHGPLSHFLQWHARTFQLQASDRFCLLGGLSHDPLLRDVFTPLWLGATLYIPTQTDIETPGQLATWMAQQEITIAHLTPAMSQLLKPSSNDGPQLDLRYVFFGGDVLNPQDVSRIESIAPQVTCVSFYGATETPQAMGYSIVPKLTAPEAIASGNEADRSIRLKRLPIGVGIADVQLLVLRSQQLAGVGEVGEIYVRTPYLAKGYLGTADHTRFRQNPFSQIWGDRLFRTGDSGRYRPDGQIEFLGRMDRQVKLRGFRIELGEVESAIRQHRSVQETAVVLWEDDQDKYLVAYWVLKAHHAPIAPSALRQWLTQQLPSYMVPSFWVALDKIPLTPNRKIDRQRLPKPQVQPTDDGPQDELERQLVSLWKRVLGRETVGANDDFFGLGGHSLLAVKLFAEIEQTFGKKLPISVLFQSPTVRALAQVIRQDGFAPWSSLVPLKPDGSKPPLFYIHAGGGNLLVYREQTLNMSSDQPVYGLQPRGLDGNIKPSNNIPEMAEFYISQIRTVQPEGPYYLAGLSTGGLIAWEMAQQFHAQGQTVNLLALFDSYGPGYPKLLPLMSRSGSVLAWFGIDVFRRIARQINKVKATGSVISTNVNLAKRAEDSDKIQEELVNRQIDQKIERYRVLHSSRAEKLVNLAITALLRNSSRPYYANTFTNGLFLSDGPLPEEIAAVRAANFKARTTYVPQPFSGKALLFRASERPPGIVRDPNLGWQNLAADGMTVYEIPGTHTSIVKSPLLAAILKQCLDEAQSHR